MVKVVEWFGYKLHLLVDVRHELALAYRITEPAVGDNEMIGTLLEQARANLPAGRIESLAYDKAADDESVHRLLHAAGIRAVDRESGVVEELSRSGCCRATRVGRTWSTTNRERSHCYDKVSIPVVRHRMAYVGHESQRGTLKYRCPAEGCVPQRCAVQRRAATAWWRGSRASWICGGSRRSRARPSSSSGCTTAAAAVERVNARIKLYWGADDGNVVGARRFHAMAGVVMLVHLALATTLARTGRNPGKTLGGTRLSPIAMALDEQIRQEQSAAGDE